MNPFVEEVLEFLSGATGMAREDLRGAMGKPPEAGMGDYAFPCFSLARELRQPPEIIAQGLAAKFEPTGLLEKAEAVGAYLNFFVNKTKFIETVLREAAGKGESYGLSDEGAGRTVVIDYSSPNIGKHLGVHHLRSSVIGQALYNIYRALGYECVGINHLGDWGRQFGELIVAYQLWGDEEEMKRAPVTHLNDLYVRFHQEARKDGSLEDRARMTFRKLEEGDEEALGLWKRFSEVSLEEFRKIYELMGISFDHYTGESFYNDMAKELVERLRGTELAKESEGALVVDLSEYGMPPLLLESSAGAALYETRDLCAAEYRYEKFKFDKMLYVVGSEQKLRFQQLFKVLEFMGYKWARRCVHVDFGLVRFKEGKLATREGRVILLGEVLDKAIALARTIIEEKNPDMEEQEEVARAVGIGAVIFADLSARRIKDVLFDWGQVLSFEGETGPYLQYTHVRLCSILRKYGKEVPREFDARKLCEAEEMELARSVEGYGEALRRAAEDYEPAVLAQYLIGLATAFNQYYHGHRVLCEDEELMRARLALVDVVRGVLRSGLKVLGIEAPERM